MNVILDSTVIIGLSKGGCFDYLKIIFSHIYLTPEVIREIVEEGKDRPGAEELSSALHKWIHVEEPQKELANIPSTQLSHGDRKLLSLAIEKGVDFVLTDDIPLQKEASKHSLIRLKTTDLLILLKEEGLVSSVRSTMDEMIKSGFGIDKLSYEEALLQADES